MRNWQHWKFNSAAARATYEYFLPVLGAVLRLRMASLFLCWLRQDVIFRAGGEDMCRATDMGIHAWALVKRDFVSASSLTWFGVADLCKERCDV